MPFKSESLVEPGLGVAQSQPTPTSPGPASPSEGLVHTPWEATARLGQEPAPSGPYLPPQAEGLTLARSSPLSRALTHPGHRARLGAWFWKDPTPRQPWGRTLPPLVVGARAQGAGPGRRPRVPSPHTGSATTRPPLIPAPRTALVRPCPGRPVPPATRQHPWPPWLGGLHTESPVLSCCLPVCLPAALEGGCSPPNWAKLC